MKFYAVKKGRVPGIYLNWEECQNNTKGFSGAVFKSFTVRDEAEKFIKDKVEEKYDEIAYTDGSFIKGSAGGAAVLVRENKVIMSSVGGNACHQTNNRGELIGIILALTHTKGLLKICSDSQYSINILSNGYKAKENIDLVLKAQEAMNNRVIHFEYVPAHTGIRYNEMADSYAKESCTLKHDTIEIRQIH